MLRVNVCEDSTSSLYHCLHEQGIQPFPRLITFVIKNNPLKSKGQINDGPWDTALELLQYIKWSNCEGMSPFTKITARKYGQAGKTLLMLCVPRTYLFSVNHTVIS